MNTTLKYHPGDTIYRMVNNKVQEDIISSATLELSLAQYGITESDKYYAIGSRRHLTEDELFDSKEALLASL